MIVRKLRLSRGWSQEQLADFTGISVRTIQRLERGQRPGLETAKALAAVFETDVSTFLESEASSPQVEAPNMQKTETPAEIPATTRVEISKEEKEALRYVRDIKGFYTHALWYAIVIGLLALINLFSGGSFWVIWPALGWGIGLASHGLSVFEMWSFFGPDWEKRQVEKHLGR
ncbi:MAG: 2TM domain-containing protein [Alphaproteobacteria bacterium]